MADRRALVLLDNAADEAQVRPLLPAGVRDAVILTSRVRLAGLSSAEVIDLDVLPPEQAKELLVKIVGPDRVAREPEAAATIVGMCGNLPLALRIVGARLPGKPHWRLQRLTDRLGAEHLRLDELAAGDLEVRASVALSYRGLGVVEQRAFRPLGLVQAPDVAPSMLSALLDIPAVEADNIAESQPMLGCWTRSARTPPNRSDIDFTTCSAYSLESAWPSRTHWAHSAPHWNAHF